MKRHVVIVDQSEPPGSLNGIQVFGPYTLKTAEFIMAEIDGEAMEGDISFNTIAVAPINEGPNKVHDLIKLLTSDDDDITSGPGERGTP